MLGAVQLTASDKAASLSPVGVGLFAGSTDVPIGLPGWETDTINGVPAVPSARDGKLCLYTRGHTLCVEADDQEEPADLTKSLWPAGRRELLVEVSGHLTLAKSLDGPTTW